MVAYDRCTYLRKTILPIVLPSMVEAENFSDHPRTERQTDMTKLIDSFRHFANAPEKAVRYA
jgi:hypothetical protein